MNNIIKQITLSGMLVSLSIIFGVFLYIPPEIFLLGIVVFLMPMFLDVKLLIPSVMIAGLLTDIFTGFIGISWITIIAYTLAALIVKLFIYKVNTMLNFMIGVVLASITLTTIYFLLMFITFDKALAIKTLIGTSIQSGVVVGILLIIYMPIKVLSDKILV